MQEDERAARGKQDGDAAVSETLEGLAGPPEEDEDGETLAKARGKSKAAKTKGKAAKTKKGAQRSHGATGGSQDPIASAKRAKLLKELADMDLQDSSAGEESEERFMFSQ